MPERQSPPRWAQIADAIVLAFLLVALYVAVEGGFISHLAGVRVTARSVWRPLAWAAALLAVRHYFVPSPNIYRWIGTSVLVAARTPGPLRTDVPTQAQRAERRQRRREGVAMTAGAFVFYVALTGLM